METTALKTTIAYESKLVKRNWLFYLFILGILGYTLGVLIPWNINQVLWSDVALASSIPSRSVYFLNLFQSLIVAFIPKKTEKSRNPESPFHTPDQQWKILSWRIFRYSYPVFDSRCRFHGYHHVYQYIHTRFAR